MRLLRRFAPRNDGAYQGAEVLEVNIPNTLTRLSENPFLKKKIAILRLSSA